MSNITIARSDLITALKQVFNTGKYGIGGTLKSGNITDYVYIYAPEAGEEAPVYFLNGNDFTFVRVIIGANVDEPVAPSVLDINSLRKYLGRWKCNTIRMSFGESFHMWGSGSVTLPFINEHPYSQGLQTMHNNTKHITFVEELEEHMPRKMKTTERVTYDLCLTIDGDELKNCMSNCELVGTGVYMFDYDGENQLNISSQNQAERFNTAIETQDLFESGEPATMQMTVPLNAFLNKEDKCNLYLKDEFPLLLVTQSEALIYRAPYRPN